jgi:hypothetical protein
MADSSKTSTRYLIVSGQTLKELENNVNDIIAQGWQADRIIITGWKVLGGLVYDGHSYSQTLVHPD